MEAKWPFLLLVLFFIALTGYVMSKVDRTKIMSQWDKRRCDFTVMLAARFFKPEADPRTPAAFSADNFDFCTKEYSERFLQAFMAPVTWLMGKQAGLTSEAMGAMNQVREITRRVTDAFLSYLSSYTKKLSASMFQFRRIVAHLRMAVQRMLAIAMSTIYMGMTLFRGMLSSIQVVIRVILILCAIMIAVIIILWFILLPVIPFIITTLTAVVALVGALSVVMSTSLASQAESQKGGFCFAEDTLIAVRRSAESIPIQEVELGDELEDGSIVTMILKATSEGVEWYEVDGIWVAGDHRIQAPSGEWGLVRDDPRARPSSSFAPHTSSVYCLNTTTRQIPLRGKQGTLYRFRDWEEFEEDDVEGHQRWREEVDRHLNPESPSECPSEESDLPLVGEDVEVHTPSGWQPISHVVVGDILLTHDGLHQRVLGVVRGVPSALGSLEPTCGLGPEGSTCVTKQWSQGGYVWDAVKKRWIPATPEGQPPMGTRTGWNVVTETGEWMARTPGGITRRRDFTEVGHLAIKALYPIVSARLTPSPSPA